MKKEYLIGKDGRPTNNYRFVPEPDDIEFIKKNYGHVLSKDMARKFGVSTATMKIILDSLIPSRTEPDKKWTQEEDDLLRSIYGRKKNGVIASILGKRRKSVAARARFLKLKKTMPDEGTRQRLLKRDVSMCSGRFCERKTICQHHSNWLRLNKPTEGLLNHNCTTRCISDGLFRDFYPNDNE